MAVLSATLLPILKGEENQTAFLPGASGTRPLEPPAPLLRPYAAEEGMARARAMWDDYGVHPTCSPACDFALIAALSTFIRTFLYHSSLDLKECCATLFY